MRPNSEEMIDQLRRCIITLHRENCRLYHLQGGMPTARGTNRHAANRDVVGGISEMRSQTNDRVCPSCDTPLPLSEFGICKARKDGRNLYCKACIRKRVTLCRERKKAYKAARKAAKKALNEAPPLEAEPKPLEQTPAIDEDGGRKRSPNKKVPKYHIPKPGELDAVWPNIRSETYVEMVFGVIKERGQCTHSEIVQATQLAKDQVGVAIADLMLWRKAIGSIPRDNERIYFVK